MATRKDVAEKAGVSPATVSHVINCTKYVSPELRKKVEEAIRTLNYRPNMVARSLATKVTKHVGILVNNIMNPYYGEIAQGMEEIAHKHGYMVSLCITNGDPEDYFTNIIQRQMDGLFITTSEHGFSNEQISKLYEAGITLINGGIGSSVEFNYAPAVDKVIKYLAYMGHKRIGFLSGLPISDPAHARYTAYKDGIKRYGLEDDNQLIIDGEYPYYTTHRTGYEAAKKLLTGTKGVTAVIAVNDLMAIGAMRAIKEGGYEIPEDISIVGCDDIFLAECVDPPLTTIRAPKKEMGRQAMHLMLQQIKESRTTNVILDMDLIIRDSTSKAVIK